VRSKRIPSYKYVNSFEKLGRTNLRQILFKENEFKADYYVSKCTFESTCLVVRGGVHLVRRCCVLDPYHVVVGIDGVCLLCASILGMYAIGKGKQRICFASVLLICRSSLKLIKLDIEVFKAIRVHELLQNFYIQFVNVLYAFVIECDRL
jgi:hypothetical protein